jgi:UDP-GlcNAc:undecaprenyl-phosphate/decaprenyl-phosphate GlcNAc-1-phosphate transferase
MLSYSRLSRCKKLKLLVGHSKHNFMYTAFPLIAALLSGIITLALCLNAKKVSSALGILDVPDERKLHRVATPLMGGIVLQFAFLPMAAATLFLSTPSGWAGSVLVWLACILAMTIVGIADDRHSLSARDRLFISFLVFGSAALVDPVFNVRILSFPHFGVAFGLGTGLFAVVFTTVCCVGLVNAVNMADGKNGLVIGLCLGWIALLAFRAPAPLFPFAGLLIAVLLVLLFFNLKGRLFLGDGGAYGFATAIGLLAIMTYNSPGKHGGRAISADEMMLLFAVPVIDAFRLTYVRVRQGRSPMAADRDHLHHHLQSKFGWPGGLLVYLLLAILPSALFFTR